MNRIPWAMPKREIVYIREIIEHIYTHEYAIPCCGVG
jgi:hypothetical protein